MRFILDKNFFPIILIFVSILIGYYKVFLGYNFWLYADQLINSSWSYGNAISNGWRPDKGFGISFFYSDTGTWHPWSLQVFWNKLLDSRELSYSTIVILNSFLSALSVYFLMKRVAPNLNNIFCALLCPLIVFSISMDAIHFNKHNSVILFSVPLMLIVIHDFLKQAKFIHIVSLSLIFFYQLFFGMFLTWSVLPSLAFIFMLLYLFYYKKYFYIIFSKFLFIITMATVIALLLGFWEIYSIFMEKNLVEYERSKEWFINPAINLIFLPDIALVGKYLLNIFSFYTIPTDTYFYGAGWRPLYFSWNITAFFPIILLYFIYRESRNFWEYAIKWLVLIYYIAAALYLIPAVGEISTLISNFFLNQFGLTLLPLVNWYFKSWAVYIKPMQLVLIALFFNDLLFNQSQIKHFCSKFLTKTITGLLLLFILSWLVFSLFSVFFANYLPNLLSSLFVKIGPESIHAFSNEILSYFVWFNLTALQETIYWYSILLYLFSLIILWFFLKPELLTNFFKKNQILVGILIFLTSIFYAWNTYPLNNKPLVWNEVFDETSFIKPYDRVLYVAELDAKSKYKYLNRKDFFIRFKKKIETAGGPYNASRSFYTAFNAMIFEAPGLNLHGHLGFYQENVNQYINNLFKSVQIDKGANVMRDRYMDGFGPVVTSNQLNKSSIKYYYSENKLNNTPENLKLIYQKESTIRSPQELYIYLNDKSWPYYYLAKNIVISKNNEFSENIEFLNVYLNKEINKKFILRDNKSSINLTKFSYGEIQFVYKGEDQNLLVIADTWHPQWKATFNEKKIDIIKANGIFKAIVLPPGEGNIRVYFDNSKYFFGIYISIISWIILIMYLLYLLKKRYFG